MFPVPGKTEKTAGFLLPDVFFLDIRESNAKQKSKVGWFLVIFPGHAADHDWMVKKLERMAITLVTHWMAITGHHILGKMMVVAGPPIIPILVSIHIGRSAGFRPPSDVEFSNRR